MPDDPPSAKKLIKKCLKTGPQPVADVRAVVLPSPSDSDSAPDNDSSSVFTYDFIIPKEHLPGSA